MGVQERKEREKQARQEAILAAAQQIFLAKGVDQTTIEDIAERAELSKGAIYLYFQSKEEIYISVLVRGLELLYARLQSIKENLATTAADVLMYAVRDVYFQFYQEYPEFLYMNSLFHHGRIKEKLNPLVWALTNQIAKKCLQVLSDIIQAGITAGLFRAVDCWKAANSFWGAATGVMDLFDDCEHQEMVKLAPKETLDFTMELMIAGLRVEKP
jgi:AcrR family transcriptional regulator